MRRLARRTRRGVDDLTPFAHNRHLTHAQRTGVRQMAVQHPPDLTTLASIGRAIAECAPDSMGRM